MNDVPSTLEWFDQRQGRGSERSRRLTFLLLFSPSGRPGWRLVLLALLSALVIGVDLGGF